MRARVFVTLKPSVFDPQGHTIAEALHSLGYGGVNGVRQGKYFELDLQARSADEARALAADVADKLLANPVIESYRIEVDQATATPSEPNERAVAGRGGGAPRQRK
jgi:phosphoribosylformylglycinamidine synthase